MGTLRQQMTIMSALVDTLMLQAREAGVSEMAMAASLQIASVELAKIAGVGNRAIERGFEAATEQAETTVAQAIRLRTFAH